MLNRIAVPIVVVPPTAEPLSLEKARKHLRITPYGSPLEHEDDGEIQEALSDARQYCQTYTRRALAEQTLQIAMRNFPCGLSISLPYAAPLIEIVSVTYKDADGIDQVLPVETYSVNSYSLPASISLAYGAAWPVVYGDDTAVKITYKAGYTEETLPRDLLRAIKLVMADFFENRENTTPLNLRKVGIAAENLMNQYRVYKDGGT